MDHGHGRELCHGGREWAASQSLPEMDFLKSLSAAAHSNDLARMQDLLRRGSPVDGDGDGDGDDLSGGYAPLHYASRAGHLEACLLLLKNGASVNKCTRAGKSTSLHRAAYAGHVDVVRALLQAGADPLLKDADGLTPLDKADSQGHTEIVKLLLDPKQDRL